MLLPIELFHVTVSGSTSTSPGHPRTGAGTAGRCRPRAGDTSESSSVPRAPLWRLAGGLRPTCNNHSRLEPQTMRNLGRPGRADQLAAGRLRSWSVEDARSAEDAVPDTHLTRPCACSPPSISITNSIVYTSLAAGG